VFLGDDALKYGLIDEFGDFHVKIKELYPKAEIVNFSKVPPFEKFKSAMSE
jgi:ClpP class serine protease